MPQEKACLTDAVGRQVVGEVDGNPVVGTPRVPPSSGRHRASPQSVDSVTMGCRTPTLGCRCGRWAAGTTTSTYDFMIATKKMAMAARAPMTPAMMTRKASQTRGPRPPRLDAWW